MSRPHMYLGVDPGMSGGMAAVTADGTGAYVSMPATERDVWEWFRQLAYEHAHPSGLATTTFAVIEKVHAMPGNGVSGMFKFGQSYGFLRACLIAAGIPFEEVTSQRWQKALNITPRDKRGGETSTQFKNRLKARAQQLFPNAKVTLATADALLLAEFCRRKCEGKL